MRVAVLDDYLGAALSLADWSPVQALAEVDVFQEPIRAAQAAERLAPYEVVCLLRERMDMPAELIRALPNLRLIVITGTHNRTLDFEAARVRGITVCHTGFPPHGAVATPELAWGLMLSVLRCIPASDASVRTGGWQTQLGDGAAGKVLGLLGLGRTGQAMARYAKAFGMIPIAWSPNLTASAAQDLGAERVEKNELFSRSDVVSIHLVLGERSLGLVGASELALMKPGAVLINTSRGPIVQEEPLVDALSARRIRAGLDVFDEEPLPKSHPLRSLPNTVVTPHIGYVVKDTMELFYRQTAENVAAYLAGAPIRVVA
jgi:phosphoglycerate dehydrogenase-like enzyme